MHHYVSSKSSKFAKCYLLSAPLTFDVSDVKLHDLAKLWFFKLIMTKLNFKRINYYVISVIMMTSRHCNDVIIILSSKNVTKITSQNFSMLDPSQ